MAVTSIDLNDLVSIWRTKTNTISTHLGDIATLTTTANGNVVVAINELEANHNTLQTAFDNRQDGTDSAAVQLMIDTSIATINGNTLINGTVGGAKLTSAAPTRLGLGAQQYKQTDWDQTLTQRRDTVGKSSSVVARLL